ncbi:unnamed protein product [Gordionus sp. m RMFG-2023]|uniref:protein PF3D7_1417600-like isoform X2 n=1 Tax=Gordionus sp. m RMFG-2023 TaxID=3053472 RepID=UPI0030DEC27C
MDVLYVKQLDKNFKNAEYFKKNDNAQMSLVEKIDNHHHVSLYNLLKESNKNISSFPGTLNALFSPDKHIDLKYDVKIDDRVVTQKRDECNNLKKRRMLAAFSKYDTHNQTRNSLYDTIKDISLPDRSFVDSVPINVNEYITLSRNNVIKHTSDKICYPIIQKYDLSNRKNENSNQTIHTNIEDTSKINTAKDFSILPTKSSHSNNLLFLLDNNPINAKKGEYQISSQKLKLNFESNINHLDGNLIKDIINIDIPKNKLDPPVTDNARMYWENYIKQMMIYNDYRESRNNVTGSDFNKDKKCHNDYVNDRRIRATKLEPHSSSPSSSNNEPPTRSQKTAQVLYEHLLCAIPKNNHDYSNDQPLNLTKSTTKTNSKRQLSQSTYAKRKNLVINDPQRTITTYVDHFNSEDTSPDFDKTGDECKKNNTFTSITNYPSVPSHCYNYDDAITDPVFAKFLQSSHSYVLQPVAPNVSPYLYGSLYYNKIPYLSKAVSGSFLEPMGDFNLYEDTGKNIETHSSSDHVYKKMDEFAKYYQNMNPFYVNPSSFLQSFMLNNELWAASTWNHNETEPEIKISQSSINTASMDQRSNNVTNMSPTSEINDDIKIMPEDLSNGFAWLHDNSSVSSHFSSESFENGNNSHNLSYDSPKANAHNNDHSGILKIEDDNNVIGQKGGKDILNTDSGVDLTFEEEAQSINKKPYDSLVNDGIDQYNEDKYKDDFTSDAVKRLVRRWKGTEDFLWEEDQNLSSSLANPTLTLFKNVSQHLNNDSVHHNDNNNNQSQLNGRPCNKDARLALALSLPFSIERIVTSPIDTFGEMLRKSELTLEQIGLVRDIRRRGKNKIAAQNCRKRKLDLIMYLGQNVDHLKKMRKRLSEERQDLESEITNYHKKISQLFLDNFSAYSDHNSCDIQDYNIILGTKGRGSFINKKTSISEYEFIWEPKE